MEQIVSFLKFAKPARKQIHRKLRIFPSLAPDGVAPMYLPLNRHQVWII